MNRDDETISTGRRTLLGGIGTLTLTAGAVSLLAACQSGRSATPAAGAAVDAETDSATLNFALGLEHEAVAAYQFALDSGVLRPEAQAVASLFQGHHQGHRDALAATVAGLGAVPVEAKAMADYAASLNVASLASQNDVLAFARTLELQAANAYLGAIPSLGDRELAKVAARLAADETMHWTVLAQATGEPLPTGPLTFGA
ncbi:MAG: ferritin-like domain-containing protein [Alphaproteobacteria bacterium]